MGEYLDEVVFPVLVVDEDVLLIAANTRRAELRPLSSLAERGGFEPPVQALIPYNRLAICPVQPLQHLSADATAGGNGAPEGYHAAAAGNARRLYQRLI